LFPELVDRTVKAATERESTHRFSTKWYARSCRLLNGTPSRFCAHSQIRQEAADNSSSSGRELPFSCNIVFTIYILYISHRIINEYETKKLSVKTIIFVQTIIRAMKMAGNNNQ
jgi:hypothetical protein